MASVATQHQPGHSTSFEPVVTLPEGPTGGSKEVNTSVFYFDDQGVPPPDAIVGRPETYNRLPKVSKKVVVHDIRGKENTYTLDKNGFQIHRHISAEKDFVDEEKIKAEYYAETAELLKTVTGASRVFIFDHTIRRAPKDDTGTPVGRPVQRVHVDQSYAAASKRVPHHLPEDAERLLQSRVQIINVWRPIKTIYKDPLGVAEADSVSEDDLVPVGLVYPDRRGETLTVKPNEQHRWYYLHGQTPEEPLFIKCYDSKLDGRARRVPHTAFENPAYEDSYTRESIEVRALVFHESESAE